MNRLLSLALVSLGAVACTACSGADSTLLDTTSTSPSTTPTSTSSDSPDAPPTADAGTRPDVTELPGLDASVVSPDAASPDDAGPACEGYADPDTTSSCHACTSGTCQANGCFGGYYCDLQSVHCVPRPNGC